LLDSHALLWLAEDSPDLSRTAREAILAADTVAGVSVASVWELAIKTSIGKLTLRIPLDDLLDRARAAADVGVILVTVDDAIGIRALPHHHRDPFDRMIVAQALRRDLTIVTRDPLFAAYGVSTLW